MTDDTRTRLYVAAIGLVLALAWLGCFLAVGG